MSLEQKCDIFLFAFDRFNVFEKVQHIIDKVEHFIDKVEHIIDKRHIWQL
jgi:hypothetical protein